MSCAASCFASAKPIPVFAPVMSTFLDLHGTRRGRHGNRDGNERVQRVQRMFQAWTGSYPMI